MVANFYEKLMNNIGDDIKDKIRKFAKIAAPIFKAQRWSFKNSPTYATKFDIVSDIYSKVMRLIKEMIKEKKSKTFLEMDHVRIYIRFIKKRIHEHGPFELIVNLKLYLVIIDKRMLIGSKNEKD